MSNIPDKNTFANAYADKAPWDIPGPQATVAELAERLHGSILDAGCGTGENALFFAERGHSVTGIDYLEEPIRRAKQKATERGLSANFLVMDALHLQELPQTFDNVLDCGLFHVFNDADRARYVEGLAETLKPGGTLVLTCFSDQETGEFGPRRVSPAELRAAFARGWTIESIAPVQIQVIPEFSHLFTAGGPKAWRMVATRGGAER